MSGMFGPLIALIYFYLHFWNVVIGHGSFFQWCLFLFIKKIKLFVLLLRMFSWWLCQLSHGSNDFCTKNLKKHANTTKIELFLIYFFVETPACCIFLRLKCHLRSVIAVAFALQTVLPDGITNNTNARYTRKYLNLSEYFQHFRIKSQNEACKCFQVMQIE